jgi:hypothetical protein
MKGIVQTAFCLDIAETDFDRKLFAAATKYDPRPFRGRLIVLQAASRPTVMDLRDSWHGAPVGALEIHDVCGDVYEHRSTHCEPQLAGLADRINAGLLRGDRESVDRKNSPVVREDFYARSCSA